MYKANKNLVPTNVHNLIVNMYGHVHTRQTGNFQHVRKIKNKCVFP